MVKCTKNIRNKIVWRFKDKRTKYGTIKFNIDSSVESGDPIEREVEAIKHLMFNYDFFELEQLKIARVINEEHDSFDT